MEFISVPGASGIEIQQLFQLLTAIAGGLQNLPAGAEARFVARLPLFVDKVNAELHPRGLHLAIGEGNTIDLQHRADGTTAGTNEEKAAYALEVIHRSLEELTQEFNASPTSAG